MRYVVSIALILVGILHLAPLVGVLGPERLAALYGITVDEPSLEILMRHRAVLFGILGVFLVLAAFIPKMQATAMAAGFVSLVSFLLLAWSTGSYNANVGKVVTADIAGLVVLCLGIGARIAMRSSESTP